MTSKEALFDLYKQLKAHRRTTKQIIENKQQYEQIWKDLEVLEIIKKWSFIQENYKDGCGKFTQFLCNIHTIGMKEDFKKVKEWLENDD